MTRPRKALISLADTPYYHITSRCVRRAYLCGADHYSGKSYEHQRQWIVDRIRLLSSVFAIDICAYAVMSNHYHMVVKLCPQQLDGLSDDEIIERWCALFKGPLLVQGYRSGTKLKSFELDTLADIVRVWRSKLASISWFMRCLNQPIARQANLEDGCTGKFWESRFDSQALKSEEALLSAMVYADLNPVRAEIEKTPEASEYTSIRERLHPEFDKSLAIADQRKGGDLFDFGFPLKQLLPFHNRGIETSQSGIPFRFEDYIQLVDWTGRLVRNDKRGYIDETLPPILERMQIAADRWLQNATRFEAIHRGRFNRIAPEFSSG